MRTVTEELLKELKNTSDMESFFQKHENQFIHETTASYLQERLEARNMKMSTIANDSGAGEYVYKIFRGERNPSRDILIAIALSIKLSLEETQLLLRISKFAILDARNKRDSIILYGLTHNLTVFQIDDMLAENDLITLR